METSQIMLSFANISGKKIEADFDGGATTSDGGALLLRQQELRGRFHALWNGSFGGAQLRD